MRAPATLCLHAAREAGLRRFFLLFFFFFFCACLHRLASSPCAQQLSLAHSNLTFLEQAYAGVQVARVYAHSRCLPLPRVSV